MARDGRPERREPRFGKDDAEERVGRPTRADARPARNGKTSRRKRRSLTAMLVRGALICCVWGGVAAGVIIAYEAAQLPPIDQLSIPRRPPNIAILASDGTLLANRGDTGGAAVRLTDLPPYLPKAFVAIEDRRFYTHFGIDPIGISRALISNLVLRRSTQGGSTLTQQLAKNLFLTQERTISRKIQEAILAIWLEHKYTKAQILELYLNRVYFGSGAFGVEAAAHKYFNTDARKVTVAQAAMLAGLMKAPTKLAPNRNPEAAIERAAQVVTAMREEGYITPEQATAALATPAHVVRAPGSGALNYAADYVVDSLDDVVGAFEQDIVVSTTIDRRLELAGERALTDELAKKGDKFNVSQGAIVALDPDGSIRVLIGGRDYAESQFNRAVAAKRQPGSAFKPFVYLAGLEKGLTPDSVREDGPINVRGWRPENYSHEYQGPVTLTRALSQSLNTVAVRICLEAGPKQVVATAHRLGIASELQPNASIALGTSEVTPLELVTAYVPFANGGIGVQPHIITKVATTSKRVLYQRRGGSNGQVVSPANVAMMNTMMTETLASGTARKGALPNWQAGGKTGTSQDFRDAWFVGYTSRLVTGVWLGNDDSSPTHKASGGTLPVEIWARFMREATAGQTPAPLPYGTTHGAPETAREDGGASVLSLFGLHVPPSGEEPHRAAAASPAAIAPTRLPSDVVRAAAEPPPAPERTIRTPYRANARPPLEADLPPADIPEAPAAARPARTGAFLEGLFGKPL